MVKFLLKASNKRVNFDLNVFVTFIDFIVKKKRLQKPGPKYFPFAFVPEKLYIYILHNLLNLYIIF